jgi:hypothetical protein
MSSLLNDAMYFMVDPGEVIPILTHTQIVDSEALSL